MVHGGTLPCTFHRAAPMTAAIPHSTLGISSGTGARNAARTTLAVRLRPPARTRPKNAPKSSPIKAAAGMNMSPRIPAVKYDANDPKGSSIPQTTAVKTTPSSRPNADPPTDPAATPEADSLKRGSVLGWMIRLRILLKPGDWSTRVHKPGFTHSPDKTAPPPPRTSGRLRPPSRTFPPSCPRSS